jgi:cytosine/adenosine deaminase-related metal-dependent hydrolase
MALRLTHGQIFHRDPAELRPGDLVTDGATVAEQADAAEVLDASGGLVIPGLVIAHHHLYSALARGMPGPSQAPTTFREVLERIWWRLDRALDGDLNELSARAGAAEALRCGVTTIVDHHASPCAIEGSLDRIAAGVAHVGARAVLCYEATNRHGDEGFAAGLDENRRLLERCASGGVDASRLRAMVGGHAPFTLSDGQLTAMADLASKHDSWVHLHVAEAADDQRDARARGATDVVARLEVSGIVAGKSVIAHGVHLSDDEVSRLGPGAWLTHQPRSNMNNHVGYFEAARRHARVALGTDGINGDLFDEAHAGFFRLRGHDGGAGAEEVWRWLAGGWALASEAFGLPAERGFGRLDPGCPADFVVLDYDAVTPVTAGSLPWHLAFGISARHVRHVVVAGEVVVRDGRLVREDVAELRRAGHAGAERLWARMAELDG